MQVADHDTEAHPAIGQHLVQTILLRGQLTNQFLPLACDQTQFPQLRRWHERATQRTGARQCRQPVGVTDVHLTELNLPEDDKSPTACLACALYGSNPGCESVRRVTLGAESSRKKLSRPLPATFHPVVSFIFRGGASTMIVRASLAPTQLKLDIFFVPLVL